MQGREAPNQETGFVFKNCHATRFGHAMESWSLLTTHYSLVSFSFSYYYYDLGIITKMPLDVNIYSNVFSFSIYSYITT